MDLNRRSGTILLALERKTSGKASCKSQQLPWERKREKMERKPCCFKLSQHGGYPRGKEGSIRKQVKKTRVPQKACFDSSGQHLKEKEEKKKEKFNVSKSGLRKLTDPTEPHGGLYGLCCGRNSGKEMYIISLEDSLVLLFL